MYYQRLTLECFEEIIPLFMETFNDVPWNEEWTQETARKRLSRMVRNPASIGYIAYNEEEKICGMVLGHKEQESTYDCFVIDEICISNAMRKQGLGSQILQYLEKKLAKINIKKIKLQTLTHEPTIGFYEKNGYSKDTMVSLVKETGE